ncbi:MAG: hypothetical protein HWQ41_15010 [Nostoc sp. NOS(2021)]|uniref:hypothetical protein n=1 Tax=Nostoc sp. NOS(2021) TaxID=2815407 RepID=UPI0025F53BDB|nr:hypothetical protein [Nostoc sp. NOS(2021)]MBN3896520.1 hypothetical protein [Nostoc sp. NOS(2021)]
MKIKFSDVKIGDNFTHELLDRVMIKLNDEAYGFSMSNAKNIKENHKDLQKVFIAKIEPNTPLAETLVDVKEW